MALHCPATLHLVPEDLDLGGLRGLAEALHDARVACVLSAPLDGVTDAAQVLASLLGVPARTGAGLEGAEDSRHEALASIADEFRGEHVVVLTGTERSTLEVGDDVWRRVD